jgi:signal transduction histidine kinase
VKNTGIGMDAQTLQHAIEPFYTTKSAGKGTELGLPMVLGMTEQTGDKLYPKSKPGEGTTVEIRLPVTITEEEKKPQDAPAASTVTPALRIVGSMTIQSSHSILPRS